MISRAFLSNQLAKNFLFKRNLFSFAAIKELQKEEDWEELVINCKKPLLLDFYADWCGPCKKLMPLLQQHLDASDGKFDVIKVNIDRHSEIASALEVSSVPQVFLVHNGEPVDSKQYSNLIYFHFFCTKEFQGFQEKKLEEFVNKAKQLGENTKSQ